MHVSRSTLAERATFGGEAGTCAQNSLSIPTSLRSRCNMGGAQKKAGIKASGVNLNLLLGPPGIRNMAFSVFIYAH